MFCGCALAAALLLPAVARAAFHSQCATAIVANVSAGDERDLGRFARAARFSDEQRVQGDEEDAMRLSEALWKHSEVRTCLERAVSHRDIPQLEPSGPSLMEQVWELEMKREVLKGLKAPLIQYLSSAEAAEKFRSEAEQHTAEKDAAEVALLGNLKRILENDYRFHYDEKKDACTQIAAGRLQAAKDQVEAELTTGCSGTCSKASKVIWQCQETPGTPCPEGTSCRCQFQKQKGKALAVGAVAYLLTTGVLVSLLGPGGALVPGPGEMATLTSFLVATRAEGCRCLLSPCKWDAEFKACMPEPAKKKQNAQNPYQAALPYVGLVCAAKTEKKCELRPCAQEDGRKVGKFGSDTFNCQQASAPVKDGEISFQDAQEDPQITFPPLQERLKAYAEHFPEFLQRFQNRQAVDQEEEKESEQDVDEEFVLAQPKPVVSSQKAVENAGDEVVDLAASLVQGLE